MQTANLDMKHFFGLDIIIVVLSDFQILLTTFRHGEIFMDSKTEMNDFSELQSLTKTTFKGTRSEHHSCF